MGSSREGRQRRPLFGADLRLGAVLALGLGLKFAPPMLSAKLEKAQPQQMVAATTDPTRPPTDALTNTLPTSVKAAGADDPPVLAAPVFAFDERSPIAEKPTSPPPKTDPIELPKPAMLAAASKKSEPEAPKPIKLRPPESIRDDQPIFLADAPKKSAAKEPAKDDSKKDATTKPAEKKGPIHPYFQRYLDQKEYYVRPGDTLESIAHRLYQDEAKSADLLAANKDSLASADALKPGMTIKLP